MDQEFSNKVKILTIIALFSDDYLMDLFVLKGGNALDIIHKISARGSLDIDLSIESDFDEPERELVKSKIKISIEQTFRDYGFEAFDITFQAKPEFVSDGFRDFWGGYEITFKIIEKGKYTSVLSQK